MNWRLMWAAAVAEMRLDRRLARLWIFLIFTLIMCASVVVNALATFTMTSAVSSSTLINSPLMAPFSMYPMLIGFMTMWVVFFAFDVRARDKRERLDEVIGALPLSNLELIAGRAAGITVLMLIPSVVIIGIYYASGIIIQLADPLTNIGPPEPYLTLATILIDAVPNILFWVSLTMVVTLVVRFRAIALVLMLGLIGLMTWGQNSLPMYVLNVINPYTSGVFLPSEVAPTFTTLEILLHRFAMLAWAVAFLCLSALLYPRLDAPRSMRLGIASVVLVVVGGISFQLVNMQYRSQHFDRMEFAEAHQPYADRHEFDVAAITGDMHIDPGGDVQFDGTLATTTLRPFETGEAMVFSLNPGYEITALSVNGDAAEFDFDNGLLAIKAPSPIRRSTSVEIAIQAEGELDLRFAYLDSAIELLSSDIMETFGLIFQGFHIGVNSRHYVALVPDLAWYPLPGAHVNRGIKDIRPRDFFALDLKVNVPSDWHVGGPGKSALSDADRRRIVAFTPMKPISAIALFASEFERRTTEIDGIEFELLVAPDNTKNVDAFAPVLDEIKTRVSEILARADEVGLSYPYEAFTLVESPINLRSYAGGWRMDSAQTFPGVFAIREGSFLQAEFGPALDRFKKDPDMSDEERTERSVAFVNQYFSNDVSGGNVFLAGANNLMQYQTDATGPGAIPLSYLVNYLARRLAIDQEGFYSVYVLLDTAAQSRSAMGTMQVAQNPDGNSLSSMFYEWNINQPDVWDALVATPLGEIEFTDIENAKSNLHLLHLWGRAKGDLLRDWLGDERLAQLLSDLRNRYEGTTYTFDDFVAVAADHEIDLRAIFGDWLNEVKLAGFRASPVQTVRLPDQEYGVPLYESSFRIENAESAPGLIAMEYATGGDLERGSEEGGDTTKPVPIPGNSAVQVALTSESPLQLIRVKPYLSYNRTTFSLDVPRSRREPNSVERDALPVVQPIEWQLDDGDTVVIDDLDTGFSVAPVIEGTSMPWFLSFFTFAFGSPPKDQGLTAYGTSPNLSIASQEWMRQQFDQAYGKYRRTLARAFRHSTPANAHFEATLPTIGNWRLEYHLPDPSSFRNSGGFVFATGGLNVNVRRERRSKWGDFEIWVVDGETKHAIEFDGESVNNGWNLLGEFDIQNPLVKVSVSTSVNQGSVVADAVRWTPAS